MHLKGIDILRGLAVSSVILYHFFEILDLQKHLLYPYISFLGLLGVSLFFIISGYLIYQSIEYSIQNKGFKDGIKNYFLHRLFRIIPAYYVNLFLVFIIAYYFTNMMETWSSYFIVKQIFSHLIFTSYFIYQTSGLEINGAYWTLSIEMLWYMVAPVFLLTIKKDRYYLLLLLLGFVYFYMIDIGIIDTILDLHKDAANYVAMLFFVSFMLPGQIIYFIIGLLIYKYPIKTIQISKPIIYILFIMIMTTFIYLSLQTYFLDSFVIRNGVTLITVTSLFILLYRTKIDELFILSWLGKISYSLYLWHMPILFVLKKYYLPHEPSWWLISILFIALLLSISSLSYYFVEEIGFKFRKKIKYSL